MPIISVHCGGRGTNGAAQLLHRNGLWRHPYCLTYDQFTSQSATHPCGTTDARFLQIKSEENKEMSMKSWCNNIIGTARSMGIRIVPKPEDA
jgi:hypothetical protein